MARAERIEISGGSVITPTDVVSDGRVLLSEDQIAAVGTETPTVDARRIDATGRYVLPGLVDLHGDDVERHLTPRSGARVPVEVALSGCVRANLAWGITTKFHALAFETTPDDDRSIATARELADAIVARDGPIDERVHARCELSEATSVEAVVDLLAARSPDLVSLMTHVPGDGQFEDREAFARRYTDGGAESEATDRLIDSREGIPQDVRAERIERVVRSAREAGAVVASHDDATPKAVADAAGRGVSISEYPLSLPAAVHAKDLGLVTAMGAPNLVRGGSMWGNLNATDAIEAGVLDVICSDYHPPSLLTAPFVDTGEPLSQRVARVTSAPAEAVGLDDRGRIEPGARADLIVVDPDPTPRVERVFVAGREVYRTVVGNSGPADGTQ